MIKIVGLLSPVIVPLILSLLLVLSSEKSNKPKLFLAAYMLIITYVFLANLFYFEHNYRVYSWLHSMHIATVLAIYPGAYIYIRLLIEPGVKLNKLLWHFLPALFFFFASALIFFPFLSQDERITFLKEYRYNPDFSKTWMKILYIVRMANILVLFIQVFAYVFLIISTLKKYRNELESIFSSPDRFRLNWLRFFNLALAGAAFVSVFLYTVNPAKLFGDDRYLAYPMLLIAIVLWFLGIMGNNQKQDLTTVADTEEANNDPAIIPELLGRLIEYFSQEKPYLDPELKIWDVARATGSNRTYISQVINKEFGQNFSSFVNTFRVKEAEKLLQENPQLPLQELVEKTGFGSESSINRAFQKIKGKKLSTYR